MLTHLARGSVIALIASLIALSPVASASAADATIGEAFSNTPDCGPGFTLLQTGPSSYIAPTDGVITSWRTFGSPTPTVMSLKIGRTVDAGASYTVVGTSSVVDVPTAQLSQHPVRITVRAGDALGYYLDSTDSVTQVGCGETADSTFTYRFNAGDTPVGGGVNESVTTGYRANVAATVEPDADRDGFGDTTQDGCPSQAAAQGACLDIAAPQTSITKLKTKKAAANKKKGKLVVALASSEAGSTFVCAVDKKASAPCATSFKKKLKLGRHTLTVYAKDAAGNIDATPAVQSFKIKKKKK